jgi:hypothetical protein
MQRLARFAPTLCFTLLVTGYLGWFLASNGYDPRAFASIGTRFSVPDPAGTEGYDGQFNYYIALDPNPQQVRPHLDVPAYRYQHILYPLLARILALGNAAAIPWSLVGINLACLIALCFLTGELLAERGGSRWGALVFGLWFGVILGVRLDLSEPLALLLVVIALRMAGPQLDRRLAPAALLLALAMLTKETVIPFLLGWAVWLILQGKYRKAVWLALALLPYLGLQIWLWRVFGSLGLGSGGAGATPFEWIPFAGLIQVAGVSLRIFIALFAVYLPGLLIPAVYGLWAPLADLIRRRTSAEGWLLLCNALMIAFAPFSTFREPLGILRLACGLILCMWLYSAVHKIRLWNKFSLTGLTYLLFIVMNDL